MITCPTCSSPLPSGAMICGHCGRTITAADVAAARRAAHPHEASHGAEGTHGAPHGAPPAPPSWQQRRDLQPDVEPWWASGRGAGRAATHAGSEGHGEPGVVRAPESLDWPPPQLPSASTPSTSTPDAATPGGTPPGRVEPAPARGGADEAASSGDEPAVSSTASGEHTGPSRRSADVPPATPVQDGEPDSAPTVVVPRRTAPAREAAPLRPPLIHDDAPRPTSAPLWTATIAPLPTPVEASAGDEGGQPSVEGDDGATTTTGTTAGRTRDEDGADRGTPDEHDEHDASRDARDAVPDDATDDDATDAGVDDVADVADDVAAAAGDRDASSATTDDVPAAQVPESRPAPVAHVHPDDVPGPGDTATVVPLTGLAVAPALPGPADDASGPAPLVEPPADGTDAVAEHCTQCGALLDEDDIFCGECGAVVQSVARSFTGPVAPLPPTWAPPSATAPTMRDADADADADDDGAGRGDARDADAGRGAPAGGDRGHVAPDDADAGAGGRHQDGAPTTDRDTDPGEAPAPAPAQARAQASAPTSGQTPPGEQHPAAHRGEEHTSTGAGPWRRRGRRARVDPGPPPPLVLPGTSVSSRDALAAAEAAERAAAALRSQGAPSPDAEPSASGRPPLPPGSAPVAPGAQDASARIHPRHDAPPRGAATPEGAPATPGQVPTDGTSPWAGTGRPQQSPQQVGQDEHDDVDETRLVGRRAWGVEYRLQFSTGETVTISGSGLLGRAPVVQPGETFDEVVRIVDPGRSVSKTHLEFGQDSGQLWVSDRWSGNGTAVRHGDEAPRRVQPGTRVRVHRGARVDIGEQFFVVL